MLGHCCAAQTSLLLIALGQLTNEITQSLESSAVNGAALQSTASCGFRQLCAVSCIAMWAQLVIPRFHEHTVHVQLGTIPCGTRGFGMFKHHLDRQGAVRICFARSCVIAHYVTAASTDTTTLVIDPFAKPSR